MALINFESLKGLRKNESLAAYTTFKIGGPADWFYEAKTEKDLRQAVAFARKNHLSWFILGGGSNLLIADEGFRGLVIKVQSSKFKVQSSKLIAEAGVLLAKMVNLATANSLSGLEFAAGIPGTVGGAVRGNAGAWRENVGKRVARVKVLTEVGKIKWLNKQDCRFAYRQSRFKSNKEIILEVELGLEKGDRDKIKDQIVGNLAKRVRQPQEPSAGCVFKNPKPESAGVLIDRCGLKGKRIGEAQISPQHANFIVNLGKAKAADVIELMKLAKAEVKKRFGIELGEEIYLLGFGKIR